MSVISSRRVDLKPLVTHRYNLDQIEEASDPFGQQRGGVLKVAITPSGLRGPAQCVNSTGNRLVPTMVRVAPPNSISRQEA